PQGMACRDEDNDDHRACVEGLAPGDPCDPAGGPPCGVDEENRAFACWSLTGDPADAICREQCSYGAACSDGSACNDDPYGPGGVCLPPVAIDAACDPTRTSNACEGGAACVLEADGAALCRTECSGPGSVCSGEGHIPRVCVQPLSTLAGGCLPQRQPGEACDPSGIVGAPCEPGSACIGDELGATCIRQGTCDNPRLLAVEGATQS